MRKKRATKKENSEALRGSPLNIQLETDQPIHGKNHPKGSEVTVLSTYTELGIVFVPTTRMENFTTHGTLSRVHRRVLPQ